RRRVAGWAAGLLTAAAAVVAVAVVGIGDLGPVGGGGDGADMRAAEDPEVISATGPLLVATGTDYRPSALPARGPGVRPDAGAVSPPAMEPRISTENDVDDSGDRPSTWGIRVDPALRSLWQSPRPCLAQIEAVFAPAPARVDVVDFAR